MEATVAMSSRHMSVSQRLRRRRSMSAGPPLVDSTTFNQTGDATVTPVRLPDTMAVDESANIQFDVQSQVTAPPDNPDFCNPPEILIAGGLDVHVVVKADGNQIHGTDMCLPATDLSRDPRRLEFNIVGVSAGEVDLVVEVYGNNTGTLHADFHHVIQVGDGGNGGGVSPGDPPDGGNGDNGDDGFFGGPILPCWADPNHSCGTGEMVAWTAGATVAGILVLNIALD